MTSRQLQFKFLRPLPYGVKSPILTTNIDVEIPPSGTHNWSNARRMPDDVDVSTSWRHYLVDLQFFTIQLKLPRIFAPYKQSEPCVSL